MSQNSSKLPDSFFEIGFKIHSYGMVFSHIFILYEEYWMKLVQLSRLRLLVAVFSASIYRRFSECCLNTVYTVQFFPLVSADNSEYREKLSLSRYIFETGFHSMWNMGHSSTWSCLFYSQHLHTSLSFYMDDLSALCKDVRRKNRNGARAYRPTFSIWFASYTELPSNTYRKKL